MSNQGTTKYKCRCGKVFILRKDGTIPQHVRPMNRVWRRPGRSAWDLDRCGLGGQRPEMYEDVKTILL